jgi:hypothetical protein
MKDRFHQWLSQRASVTGILACALRFPDHTTRTEIRQSDFSREGIENAWRCVADTFQVLKHHRSPGVHLRWVFEQALLFCLTRPDDICLMVFTTSKAQELDVLGLQAMFDEFHLLAAG